MKPMSNSSKIFGINFNAIGGVIRKAHLDTSKGVDSIPGRTSIGGILVVHEGVASSYAMPSPKAYPTDLKVVTLHYIRLF